MKHIYSLYIFILLLTSIFSQEKYEEKIIYFPIQLYFDSFCTTIYMGEPAQKTFLPLDQEMQILWADLSGYKPENSISYKQINDTKISFRYYEFHGKTLSDKVILRNNIDINTNKIINQTNEVFLDDFYFIMVGNIRGFDNRVRGLGLAYKFADERYSLIHQLKYNKLINHLNYGFIPPSYLNSGSNNLNNINDTSINKDGIVFFGGIPKYYIFNKYRYNCKLNEKYNFWSCDLPYVFIGNIDKYNSSNNLYFKNENYAYFNAAERRIMAPKDFIYFLKVNYFQDDLLNGNCKFYLYGANHIFECLCSIQNKFPNISFIFNNYKYTFSSSELWFNYGGGFCHFLIQENSLRQNNFLFGSIFLSKFISNFDYETKYISFYSENQLEEVNIDEIFHPSHIKRYLFIFGIFLIFLGIYLFIRKKIRDKKHKKELLLKFKSKGKDKIKKMNDEEEGYEMN